MAARNYGSGGMAVVQKVADVVKQKKREKQSQVSLYLNMKV